MAPAKSNPEAAEFQEDRHLARHSAGGPDQAGGVRPLRCEHQDLIALPQDRMQHDGEGVRVASLVTRTCPGYTGFRRGAVTAWASAARSAGTTPGGTCS